MRSIQRYATSQSIRVRFIDSSDGTPETGVLVTTNSLELWFQQDFGLKTIFSPVTLGTLSGVYLASGLLHISDGYYRVDSPNAAFSGIHNTVIFGGSASGMVVIGSEYPIVDYNPQSSSNLGLSSLPTTTYGATGGLLGYGTGTGQLDTISGKAYISPSSIQEATNDIFSRSGTIETNWGLQQTLRVCFAALAGLVSGVESSTITFRNVGDTKNRIVATIDSNNNRISVTLDGD